MLKIEMEQSHQKKFVVGEKIIWHGGSPGLGSSAEVKEGIYHGKICWIGKIKEFGEKFIVGVEMDKPFKGSCNGMWQNRPYFTCKPGHGIFLPVLDISSVDEIKSKTLERSQETSNGKGLMKLKNRFSSEGNNANAGNSPGKQPGSPKPSSTKGGTIFNKGNKVTNKSSSSLETTSENFVPKRSVSSNSIKKVFNTINKKEKKSPNEPLSSQEVVCNSEENVKLHRGGFLNIFKWFSKKELKEGKISTEKMSGKGIGSTTSLVSNSSSITFFPIRHSVSADNSNTMMKSYNKNITEEKFLKQGSLRRSSGTSNQSNVSLDSFSCRPKKRPAPKPPDLPLHKSDNIISINSSIASAINEKSFSKETQSQQQVCGKVKRKAPDPPRINKSPPHIKNNKLFSSPNNSVRPLSTFSSFSSVSHSGSSTLQSSTCSENDSLTLRSDSSQNTSSFPINKDKGTLSPKPWYKRKKVKEKSYKNKKEKGNVYEAWMPDIQYARQNVNISDTTALQSKYIETFYDRGPQIGQRFSILSSISDLDRAATEQFEKEKECRSKKGKEGQFYNSSSTHFLSQRDLVPNKEEELEGAVALSPQNASSANATYDNLNYSNDSRHISAKPPQHFNSNIDRNSNNIQIVLPSAPDLNLLENSSSPNSTISNCDTLAKINYEEYIEEIRRELENETSEMSVQTASKCTPKEKATFDPELFYQLARDAKTNQEYRLNNTRKCSDNVISSKSKEIENNSERSFQSRLKPHLKNFGLRMNNFFTPDVSTILEGSESITSSTATTTPADDFSDDVLNRSGMSIDQTNDFMSTASELNSEYRMNTTELQDVIESYVVDFRRFEGQQKTSLNSNEYENKKEKADKIREEVLLLREKDNFLMWQKVMQETELTKDDDERSIEERKKKWICSSCTLINHPWRLHCEACGSLRPPNPKRVDNDSLVGNYQQASRYASSSNDTSSVMQDNKSSAKEGQSSRDHIQTNSRVQNYRDNTANLNWERELQSYFTLFDDQTNSARQMELEKRNKMSENVNNSVMHDDSGAYGKILVSRNKISNTSENGIRFTGENKENRSQEDNVDVQELRRARVRKFQLNFSSSQEQQTITSNHNVDRENFPGSSGGVKEKIVQLSELSSGGHHGNGIVLENSAPGNKLKDSTAVFNNIDDKQFYKNEYKKSPVLKPSGAVKSVVSIFNQMDQLKAAQEKPPPVKANRRRSSFSNVLNFSDFERLITGSGSEAQRNYTPPPRTNSPVMADVDIASAINKFDEMAALAEIDNIRKPCSKLQKKCIKSGNITNEVNKEGKFNDREKYNEKHSHTQNDLSFSSRFSGNLATGASSNQNNVDNKISNRDSCDSIIRDGILYTSGESRRRSMSIGSGTFELLNAKDFASIEAHHSRKSSPNEDEIDATPSVLELSHPLLMPEISLMAKPHPGNSREKTHENSLDSTSGNDVERLSQQLTDTQGIEIFKATLARDERKLGKTNAKTLSRLLKNLEHAISNGKHEQAAKLARDLAKMRLKCSVLSKDEDSDESSEDNVHETSNTQQGRDLDESGISGADMSACGGAVGFDPSGDSKSKGVVKRTKKSSHISRREVKSDSGGILLFIPKEYESNKLFHVKMYVEDKSSHQGPIILQLQSSITVGDLKLRVADEFGFPVEVQRWILGRLLADDDSKTLADYRVTAEGCPIFLYLVAPDYDTNQTSPNMSRSSSYKSNGNQDSESKSEISDENNKEIKHKYPSDVKIISTKITSPVLTRVVQNDRNIQIESVKDLNKKDKGKREKKVNYSKSDNEKKLGEKQHLRKYNTNTNESADVEMKEKGLPQQNFNSPSFTKDGWVCPQCTLINPKDRPGCEACTTERPESFSNPGLKKKNLRQEVFALESKGCVTNQEPFDCVVCLSRFEVGEGVILRDCLHIFCRYCLINSIRYSDTARVRCPFSDKNYSCQFSLQEREIKDLLSEEDYKKHLDRSIKEAAGSMRNVFYCKTPDCKGFCQYEDSVNNFNCDVCRKINCLTCQAQHEKQSCKQYQDELQHKQDEEALKTKKFFDDIIRRGDGMPCPQCSIMLVRKWGCDWMRCPMCRTEICWVTRMPRWGPEGQGDTSGGCKCGLNGRKCHPKCTYCH
ncbi:UNVERIFIED_CONTAM: hypothetical protein RMT77_007055 [Armadillidium vulgare]